MVSMNCEICKKEIEKTSFNKKYCNDCVSTGKVRRHKYYNYKKKYGNEIKCKLCNTIIIKKTKSHIYCKECAKNNTLRMKKGWAVLNWKKIQLERPEYFLWKRAKNRAMENKIPFDIELEDIIIPNKCPLLNIDIKIGGTNNDRDNSPSIDRIIPKLGYIKDNIQIVSWRANSLKKNATLEELKLLTKNLEMKIGAKLK